MAHESFIPLVPRLLLSLKGSLRSSFWILHSGASPSNVLDLELWLFRHQEDFRVFRVHLINGSFL